MVVPVAVLCVGASTSLHSVGFATVDMPNTFVEYVLNKSLTDQSEQAVYQVPIY
jgi:hypothetical protein